MQIDFKNFKKPTMTTLYQQALVVLMLTTIFVNANPKKYDPSTQSGFQPSGMTYYKNANKTIEPRSYTKINTTSPDSASSERVQRFGISTFGGAPGYAGTGYSTGVNPGLYAPLKIDLGGVVLGTLIGLGAVLILPKLAYGLGGAGHGYGGGFGRSSEDEPSNGITELIASMEAALDKYNIDASSCMQRVVCSTVQQARVNKASGEPTTADQWVEILTTNSLFTNMLDGTAIKQAVDAGWGEDTEACVNFQPKCDVNKSTIIKMISNLLPAVM